MLSNNKQTNKQTNELINSTGENPSKEASSSSAWQRTFLCCADSEDSLPHSQECGTPLHPELDESNPHSSMLLL
jgi:hypothetical protein